MRAQYWGGGGGGGGANKQMDIVCSVGDIQCHGGYYDKSEHSLTYVS